MNTCPVETTEIPKRIHSRKEANNVACSKLSNGLWVVWVIPVAVAVVRVIVDFVTEKREVLPSKDCDVKETVVCCMFRVVSGSR